MITALKKNKFTQTLATGAATLGVLAGVGLVSAPAQAQYTLEQLVNNPPPDGIVVRDKKFDQWAIRGVPNGVSPANIYVEPIDADPLSQPGIGLKYTFLNDALKQVGPGSKQIFFDYRVSILPLPIYSNYYIKDNLLSFVADNVTGDNSNAEAHEFVFEKATRLPGQEAWGVDTDGLDAGTTTHEKDVLHLHDPGHVPPNPYVTQDGIDFFNKYKELFITKEFSVDVSDLTGTAEITEVTQNFSQVVPEPSSVLGLLAFGGLGLGMKSIKRKKQD